MNETSRGATKMFIDGRREKTFSFAPLRSAIFPNGKQQIRKKTLFTRNKSRNYWRTSERSQVARRNAKQPTSAPFLALIDTCGNVSGRREVKFREERARDAGVIAQSAVQAHPKRSTGASALRVTLQGINTDS